MKKLFLLVFALGAIIQGFSQITLEHQYYIYHKDFYVTDIGNNDYKYIISDSIGFSLYNLDYSPYLLNVVSPIPLWQVPYYQISYISSTLFDCDSTNIEYVITEWDNPPSNFYIYRTDGTLLFERDNVTGYFSVAFADGSQYLKPIENTPKGTKLFLSANKSTGQDSIYIYSLCGTLPASINEVPIKSTYVQVFPNPANGVINFQINQPNNYEKFKLTIYNSSFQHVEESDLNVKNYQIDLTKHSLSAGTYLFDLRTENRVYQTGKFIITK